MSLQSIVGRFPAWNEEIILHPARGDEDIGIEVNTTREMFIEAQMGAQWWEAMRPEFREYYWEALDNIYEVEEAEGMHEILEGVL